ncbi:AMP-binding protein [Paraburkholderia rhynchosiae]|nr:AMP-binding protein [Paraburkholderia rhynchosiae]CAB3733935.1 3-[(3aS,4S,7aS)-7a-methyl-1, 5-dioxo-octahydro-1H-inden-4-yl]propanoyl:CoA ligase [Paraburkholderia rhynchosiae]
MHLIEYFLRSAERWPDRVCLVDATGERSYSTVQDTVWAIAHAFRARGITPGTRVALYGPNSSDLMESMLGILCAECVWAPISARNTAIEAAQYLRQIEVDVLLYSESVASSVEQIRALTPSTLMLLPIDSESRLDWIDPAATQPFPHGMVDMDQSVAIMASGGTTGSPKGILLTERCYSMGVATLEAHYPGDFPVYLACAPLTHAAGGLALMLLGRGAKFVILPGFEARVVMQTIETHRITQMFLPPTAIYMMLADPEHTRFDYSSVKYFMYAGAPMSEQQLREALQAFGPVMTQFYAQMECHASITCLTAEQHSEALADPQKAHWLLSAGKPTKFARVEFMDPDGKLLPVGERGELVVRSHLVCAGYVGTAATAHEGGDGWHHTGDVGYRDADGFVYIVDRLRDIIISGGFNVFPTEVERVILSHRSVRDCAVVGTPDEKWGEAVTAVIELKDGQTIDQDELIAFCRKSLSGVKAPKIVRIVDALPRSPVGKVLRRAVRDSLWQGRSGKI